MGRESSTDPARSAERADRDARAGGGDPYRCQPVAAGAAHEALREHRIERGERGTVMVVAALAMTALLLFRALAIDVGCGLVESHAEPERG